MPIRPENKDRYPPSWREISKRIRFDRAKGRCECEGECGRCHDGERHGYRSAASGWAMVPVSFGQGARCEAEHDQPHPVTGSRVVLTVAHLDHQPENCADDNLKAMCQRCHLAYDADHHRRTRLATMRCKRTAELPFPNVEAEGS